MKNKSYFHLAVSFYALLGSLSCSALVFAQSTPEETLEKRELIIDQRLDEMEHQRELPTKPKTAEEVLEMLKKRAELRIEERRKELLRKVKVSASANYGYESNPSTANVGENGDSFIEDTFALKWAPTFDRSLSGELGYDLYNQNYLEQTDLSSFTHTFGGALKYYPFKSGKLSLEPGSKMEWLLYPLDESSGYEKSINFLKLTHYLTKNWNYGLTYEYSRKEYDKKEARDDSSTNIMDLDRVDFRNSVELWVKRFIGKYSVKLQEKSYINNSNDDYQDYYDNDSHKGYITLAGSFLKDNRLYLSAGSDLEVRLYENRLAETTTRKDLLTGHKLNAYYTINKTFLLSYSFSFKESSSNAAAGEYRDVTNKIGITANF